MNFTRFAGKPGFFAGKLGFVALAFASLVQAQQYTITTVAGIGQVRGFFGDGGVATLGELSNPTTVTVDSKGNLYIVDYLNYSIRKVDTSGNLSTIVGTLSPGESGDGAVATSAAIGQVHGLAVNSAGDVFISDTSNNLIRKISASTGNITIFAGTGEGNYGGDGGAATKAQLFFPMNIALDPSGNLFIADNYNNVIRKIDTSGNISTVCGQQYVFSYAGDGGPAAKAAINGPYGLTFDAAGNLYFSEIGNQTIRKIDKSGNISTVATKVLTQSFAVDAAGAVYYVDNATSRIWKVQANGVRYVVAGTGKPGFTGDSGPADLAQLNQPNGIAIDSSGNLYVADTSNYVVRKLTPNPFSVIAATNSASNLQAQIAPGEIVTIYGAGIGPATLTSSTPSNGTLPTTLAQTQVYIGGYSAPLLYTSATQLAAIVPFEITGSTTNITVVYKGQIASTLQVPVAPAAPGIFTSNSTGSGQAAAVNANGTVNGATAPAKIGSFVSLYITGDGTVSPSVVDGALVGNTLPRTILPVTATIGGQSATVTYSGGVPGVVGGLTQVNVTIPAGISAGSAVPVVLTVGGVQTQAGVTLSISN